MADVGANKSSRSVIALLVRGCDGDDGWACAELGDTYRLGLLDVRASDRRAAPYYGRACSLGSSTGCRNVAINYERGLIVPENLTQAATYRGRACDLGDLTSCVKMGYYSYAGMGVARDYGRAAAYYTKACDGGELGGCARHAWLLEHGFGGHDLKRAVALYVASCDKGYGPSCHQLAVLHRTGRGVLKSERAAGRYLVRACEYGEGNACIQRAEQLILGQGVARDHERAVALLEATCERHKGTACRILRPYEKTYEPRLDRTQHAWHQLHAALNRLEGTPDGADLDHTLWKFGASLSRIEKSWVDGELSKHIRRWDDWATAMRRTIRTGRSNSPALESLGMVVGSATAEDPDQGARRGAEIGAALDDLVSTLTKDNPSSQLTQEVEALRREQSVLRMRLTLRYSVAF